MDSMIEISTNSFSASGHDTNKPSVEESTIQIRFDRVASSHQ